MQTLSGLETFWRVVRRLWHVMLGIVLGIVILGTLWILQNPRSYRASSFIRITTENRGNVELNFGTLQTIERLNLTYAQIAMQSTTLDYIRNIVGQDWPDHYLRQIIRATPVKNTQLIEISATHREAEEARNFANAAAEALLERQQDLERDNPTGTTLQIVEEARTPALPSSYPRRAQFLAVTAGALFISVLLGLFIDRVDRRIESKHDISDTLQIPILGMIENYSRRHVSLANIQDSYQNLASTISHLKRSDPATALSITGTKPGEGKSFTIANLALALREIGNEVVLVDLDLRRPTLHTLFGVENAKGVGTAIKNNEKLPEPTPTKYQGIGIIPAGMIPPAFAARVYESPRLKELLEYAQANASTPRWLLVDLPPMHSTPGTATVASVFRNTMFVVRAGVTSIRDARDALDALTIADVKVLGTILTGVMRVHRAYDPYRSSDKDNKE